MISNYDPNEYGIHKITVTIQQWEYVGHIFLTVSGNCKGRDVLYFDFESYSDDEENDCNLQYDEEYDIFTATLRSPDGGTLEIEEDSIGMNNMIVGIEITDFITDEE